MLLRGGRRDVVVGPLLGVAVEEGGDGVEDDILSKTLIEVFQDISVERGGVSLIVIPDRQLIVPPMNLQTVQVL